MEHRHESRIACHFNIELYDNSLLLGIAQVENISKSGLCIHSELNLPSNARIHLKFPQEAGQYGWPDIARAIVLQADNSTVRLLFDDFTFNNFNNLQKNCEDLSSH